MLMVIIIIMRKKIIIIMIMIKKLHKCLAVEEKMYLYTFGVSAGTLTRYWLDGPGFETRWDDIFRIHPHRHRDPAILLQNEYCVSFLGIKRPRRGADHPLPSSAGIEDG
jgi:hypothetical protein